MSYQFDRKYSLTISKPPQIDKTPKVINSTDESIVVKKEEDYRSIDQLEAKVFTELNLRCTISSGKDKTNGQNSVIEVLGMSEDNLNFVRKNGVVILEAGYNNGRALPVILAGQIVKKEVDTDGDITKLKIHVSDGYTPNSAVKISREYAPQTTYQEILEDLANIYANNKIPLGRSLSQLQSLQGVGVDLPINELTLPYGHCLVGYLDTCLNQICKECGFKSYLSNSRLYIEPEDYTQTVKKFNFTTNNILSLKEITVDNNNNSKDTQEQNTGYRMRVFLDGRIEVGMFIGITVEGEDLGSFKVTKVKQDLDFEGDSWFTTMELQNV